MKLLNRERKTYLKAFFRGVFSEGKPRDQEASRKKRKRPWSVRVKKTMKMTQKRVKKGHFLSEKRPKNRSKT
nr:MAG TPA: hypothetical protein [Caudoviricetes sp.]